MTYLIENSMKPVDVGRPMSPKKKHRKKLQNMLEKGFVQIPEEDYQLIVGNIDGHEYIRKSDGSYSIYEPPTPDLEELKANKLAEVDAWTEGKITRRFYV